MMAGVTAFVLVLAVFGVVFLAPGDEATHLVLDDARAYAPGSVEFVGGHNLFVVRLGQSEFYALSDLDAPNRVAPGRRCRVQVVPADDPALPGMLARWQPRMSSSAAGSTLLLREACNNAVYDVTGVRLDADGRNLDRYPVEINGDGHLSVNLARRHCSERREGELTSEVDCG